MSKVTKAEVKKWKEKRESQSKRAASSKASNASNDTNGKGSKTKSKSKSGKGKSGDDSKESKQSAKSAKPDVPEKAPVCYMDEIIAFIKEHAQDSGIVYVLSRKEAGGSAAVELRAEDTYEELEKHGISCAFYHAGMTSAQRIRVQQAWTSDQIRVVCATIAYGMGIDKEDVRYVIHTVLPKSLEGYYQEAGRVGSV